MKIIARKFWEYGLIALIVLGLMGCTPDQVKTSVETFGSFFISPDGTRIIGYGAMPNGQEIIGTISQVGTNVKVVVGTATADETVKVTEAIAKEGWNYIPWSSIPGIMQVAILAQVEEIVNAASIMSSPLPLFMINPNFIHLNGCNISDGPNCNKQS